MFKLFKFISIFAIIFLLFNINMITVNATDGDETGSSAGTSSGVVGKDAVNKFNKNKVDPRLENTTSGVVATVLNVVKVISVGIALIFLTILATKYMVSSVEERAEIKKHAVVYIVGAVVMFSATGIISIIQTFAKVFDEAVE